MHSMLMLEQILEHAPRKIDHLRLNLKAFQGYSHVCYISYMTSYGYCVGWSWICLLILCCYICSAIFGSWLPWRSKICEKLLSVSLPSCHSGHPDLAKYHTVWATFSRYIFSIKCLLSGLYNSASTYVRHHGCFLANCKSPQQLGSRKSGFLLTECTSFSKPTIF